MGDSQKHERIHEFIDGFLKKLADTKTNEEFLMALDTSAPTNSASKQTAKLSQLHECGQTPLLRSTTLSPRDHELSK